MGLPGRTSPPVPAEWPGQASPTAGPAVNHAWTGPAPSARVLADRSGSRAVRLRESDQSCTAMQHVAMGQKRSRLNFRFWRDQALLP